MIEFLLIYFLGVIISWLFIGRSNSIEPKTEKVHWAVSLFSFLFLFVVLVSFIIISTGEFLIKIKFVKKIIDIVEHPEIIFEKKHDKKNKKDSEES